MPDEDQLFLHPADPPPVSRRPTEGSLEFLMEQIAALPTRRELAGLALLILFAAAALWIVGIEVFWRYFAAWGCIFR